MCSDQLNLKTLSKWSGKSDKSRQNLMDKLQSIFTLKINSKLFFFNLNFKFL